jgi:hypothetical protein
MVTSESKTVPGVDAMGARILSPEQTEKLSYVDGSTAHPSDLAEFLASSPVKNFNCGSIYIDKSVVVFVPIIGLLRSG